MKKIYKLREWLTLDEAAGHLTLVLGEPVSVSEALRLALDGHLTLSVNLVNGAKARLGRVVPFKDVPIHEMPLPTSSGEPGKLVHVPEGIPLDDVDTLDDDTRFVCFDKAVVSINGVWDLTMKGAEQLDVEHEFQQRTDGPAIELINLEGALLFRADGQWAQLQDRFEDDEIKSAKADAKWSDASRYFPAAGLPDNAHLVLKMSALAEFQAKLVEPQAQAAAPASQLGTRERETLLKILIGMAVAGYGHDPAAARSLAPGEIASDLNKHGISVTDDTIRKYLKEAAATVLPKRGSA